MRVTSFPTAIDAWENLTVALQDDGSLKSSATGTEHFCIRENGTGKPGVGFQERDFNQIYDLRTIGLADENSRPNETGKTLLELIRGGGKIERPVRDNKIQELDKYLRHFFNQDGSAFDSDSPSCIARFNVCH